jgi:hypothetical protein
MTTVFALELYLQNLRDMADASVSANALIADYNSALARLEEVKGTLLDNRMVQIAGDESRSMPGRLPAPEIQIPESVVPAPQAVPQPVAPPADPQGSMIAPPAAMPVEVARETPPQPAIVMPESVQAETNAYADLPVSPAPQPVMEPTPAPIIEAPVEIAEQTPPLVSPPAPTMAMPPSVLPEPAYTAMSPIPAEEFEAPTAPMVALPVDVAPAPAPPIAEQLPAVQPRAVRPYVPQSIAEAPLAPTPAYEEPTYEELPVPVPAPEMEYEIAPAYPSRQPAPTLAMPGSILPTPAPALEPSPPQSVVEPQPAKIALSQPASQRGHVAAKPLAAPAQPLPPTSLQMPESLKPARQSILIGRKPQQPAPAPAKSPSASLQLPGSIQPQPLPAPRQAPAAPRELSASNGFVPVQPSSVINGGAPVVRQPHYAAEARMHQARPLPAQTAPTSTPRAQAGPQLQLPSSVRPAAVETPVSYAPHLAYPGSVGPMTR